MAWLLRDGQVLATVEIARTFRARARGLLGRDHLGGALLIDPARSVHTVGMRFTIDVAYCDRELRVIDTTTMRPFRVGRPRRKAHAVIEAQAGAFERWSLKVGDLLELKGAEV
jgi:uncharacterized membrane protein (UPF0127 family)